MNQERLDELTRGMATARISRGQLLKGLGASFVVVGVLPSFGAKGAKAQDVWEAWAAIKKITGSYQATDERIRKDPDGTLKSTTYESSSATFELVQEFAAPEHIGFRGPREQEKGTRTGEHHEAYYESDGSVWWRLDAQGSHDQHPDNRAWLVDWMSLDVYPQKGTYTFWALPWSLTGTTSDGGTFDALFDEWVHSGLGLPGGGVGVPGDEDARPLPSSGETISGSVTDGTEEGHGKKTLSWIFEPWELIPKIPRIMRHFGWLNGARMQEIWLSGPARVAGTDFNPNDARTAPSDTDTIKMDSWVLTFPRAKQAYDTLVNKLIWNKAAKKEIAKMLAKQGALLPGFAANFGNLDAPVTEQDPDYVQQVPIAYSVRDVRYLDDMVCALGRFTLRAVVAGWVEPVPSRPGRYEVIIEEVGVYVRDLFDFNGAQFLGYWNDNPPIAHATYHEDGSAVLNSDYRAWRDKHDKGGDFLVFSDVKKVPIDPPVRFTIKGPKG